jgi:probable phosphoglycerate mutase
VLAARWIGLPVAQAQHLLLNTASVSVLCYEHERTDQPAIALWNSTAHEFYDPASGPNDGERSALKRRAIDRWENEGGEIPNQPRQLAAGQLP